MVCHSCGTEYPDGTKFCPFCGATAPETPAQSDAVFQQQEQAPQQPIAQGFVPQNVTDPYQGTPMKWHKFLVYFALWASAVLNLVNAIMCFTGAHYGELAQDIYAFFPSLKTADTIYGLLLLVIVALAVITALRLMKLKVGAPKLLTCLYILVIVSTILYLLLAASAMKGYASFGELLNTSTITSLLVSAIMLIVNIVYYRKRTSLFVN